MLHCLFAVTRGTADIAKTYEKIHLNTILKLFSSSSQFYFLLFVTWGQIVEIVGVTSSAVI